MSLKFSPFTVGLIGCPAVVGFPAGTKEDAIKFLAASERVPHSIAVVNDRVVALKESSFGQTITIPVTDRTDFNVPAVRLASETNFDRCDSEKVSIQVSKQDIGIFNLVQIDPAALANADFANYGIFGQLLGGEYEDARVDDSVASGFVCRVEDGITHLLHVRFVGGKEAKARVTFVPFAEKKAFFVQVEINNNNGIFRRIWLICPEFALPADKAVVICGSATEQIRRQMDALLASPLYFWFDKAFLEPIFERAMARHAVEPFLWMNAHSKGIASSRAIVVDGVDPVDIELVHDAVPIPRKLRSSPDAENVIWGGFSGLKGKKDCFIDLLSISKRWGIFGRESEVVKALAFVIGHFTPQAIASPETFAALVSSTSLDEFIEAAKALLARVTNQLTEANEDVVVDLWSISKALSSKDILESFDVRLVETIRSMRVRALFCEGVVVSDAVVKKVQTCLKGIFALSFKKAHKAVKLIVSKNIRLTSTAVFVRTIAGDMVDCLTREAPFRASLVKRLEDVEFDAVFPSESAHLFTLPTECSLGTLRNRVVHTLLVKTCPSDIVKATAATAAAVPVEDAVIPAPAAVEEDCLGADEWDFTPKHWPCTPVEEAERVEEAVIPAPAAVEDAVIPAPAAVEEDCLGANEWDFTPIEEAERVALEAAKHNHASAVERLVDMVVATTRLNRDIAERVVCADVHKAKAKHIMASDRTARERIALLAGEMKEISILLAASAAAARAQ